MKCNKRAEGYPIKRLTFWGLYACLCVVEALIFVYENITKS